MNSKLSDMQKLEILEVGFWKLADCKELKFWNLNLEINTTPDLEILIATNSKPQISKLYGMNCQTEIVGQILIWEDEKVLPR